MIGHWLDGLEVLVLPDNLHYNTTRDVWALADLLYPAINIRSSGTRREELLTGDEELQRMWILRKLLHGMEDLPAIEFLLDKLKDTKTNDEFFKSMKRQ